MLKQPDLKTKPWSLSRCIHSVANISIEKSSTIATEVKSTTGIEKIDLETMCLVIAESLASPNRL